jgi:hypothetical protein
VRPRGDSRPALSNGRSWRHGSHLEPRRIGWMTAGFLRGMGIRAQGYELNKSSTIRCPAL